MVESWCDKLASTPAAGLKVGFHFGPSEAILEALSPLLGRLPKGDKHRFNVEIMDPLNLVINTEEGFRYGFEPGRLSVSFNHRMRLRQVSGGPPTMEMLSQPAPFTALLPRVTERLVEVCLLLPRYDERNIKRVSIISNTSVAFNEMPPGILSFVEYIGRPWGTTPTQFQIQVTGDLGEDERRSDRCVHSMVRPEEPEELVKLTFDWQRTLNSEPQISRATLESLFAEASDCALSYFEELAEGNRFDEELLS